MSNKALETRVVKLLKIVVHAATPQKEAMNARLNACKLCVDHDLNYDALMAQAAEALAADNLERDAREKANKGRTWEDVPRHEYYAATKYDARSDASRALLARAIRDVLTMAGFSYMSDEGMTKEEVWHKVVGRGPKGFVWVKVYTSIINGRSDANGARVGGMVRGLGTDQIRLCAPGVSSKTQNQRKGHTVKRVGRFGDWTEGRDHRANNNPGILGRIYREILNVTDEALKIAQAAPAPEPEPDCVESAIEFIERMMRDYRAEVSDIPHPSRARAAQGATMVGYIEWLMSDTRNRYDRNNNDRFEFARTKIEDYLG